MHNDKYAKLNREAFYLCAAVFLLVFLLSNMTPLIADDFNYTFGYSTDRRISSLADICLSMSWHRKLLNGRVFSHGWVSLVLMYPRWVFASLNALVAAFFTWITILFFQERCERPVRATLFVWMLLWICMPGFGQVFFWTSGACNYFWAAVLAWFLIIEMLQKNLRGSDKWNTVLLLLPGFVAGAWSEHISFAMLLILLLITLKKWMDDREFPIRPAAVLLSGCAGYLYLMLAPASKLFQRMHDAGDPTEDGLLAKVSSMIPGGFFGPVACILIMIFLFLILKKSRGMLFAARLFSVACTVFSVAGTLIAALHVGKDHGLLGVISASSVCFFLSLSIFFAVLFTALNRRIEKNKILCALMFAFSGLTAFSLFLFAEYIPARGFCAPVFFMSIASVMLMEATEDKALTIKVAEAALIFCFVGCFLAGTNDILRVHRAAEQRELAFHEAAAGNKIVITSAYPCRTKYSAQYGNADLEPDADWPNGVMADYYGVVRIIVDDPE